MANGGEVVCLKLSAAKGEGVDALIEAICGRLAVIGEVKLAERRRSQAESWLRTALLQRFGEQGLTAMAEALTLPRGRAPFGYCQAIAGKMRVTFGAETS